MLLELKDLKKHFHSTSGFLGQKRACIKAVDGASLNIAEKENVGLVGESGCGKTTLARIAIKLLASDSGQIILKGEDVTNISTSKMLFLRKKIQMVFQDPFTSLDPRFTVCDIILEAMIFDEVKELKKKEERACDLLRAVKMPTDILKRFPHEFSGGERQRIAIARALAANPELLILDEAVSSLDVLIQEEILNLLHDLQKDFNITYLFISHNLKAIRKLCTKIMVMFNGKIVEVASSEEIFKNPLHVYTKELLAAAINYTVRDKREKIVIRQDARWVEELENHFVFE